MTLSRTIRWGIVGCGDVVARKAGPALQQTEGSTVHAVMSRDISRARQFAAKLGASKAYADMDDLLSDGDIDAVYIATPVFLHARQTILAARAGKHVLCEKPMGMSGLECQEMIGACRKHKVHLSVAYYRRAFPNMIRLKQLIEEHAIGRVLSARVINTSQFQPQSVMPKPWRLQSAKSGGGVLMDVGSHRLDLLNYLLGDVASINGQAVSQTSNIEVDETAVFSAKFASGAVASGEFSWNHPRQEDWIEVCGTRGVLRADPLNSGHLRIESDGSTKVENLATLPYPHSGIVANFVRVIAEEASPLCDGATAAVTNQLIDKIYS